MNNIISTQEITSTDAYIKLEKVFQQLALRLSSKKIITHGLIVFKSTGVIPGSIAGNNLLILKNLIKNNEQ